MITENDLMEAIAECQGTRSPNANTCIKLAAYYIILDHMKQTTEEQPVYSYSPPPLPLIEEEVVDYDGESDFAKAIHGMNCKDAWGIMDELMSTLSILHPNLYNGVLRKLSDI